MIKEVNFFLLNFVCQFPCLKHLTSVKFMLSGICKTNGVQVESFKRCTTFVSFIKSVQHYDRLILILVDSLSMGRGVLNYGALRLILFLLYLWSSQIRSSNVPEEHCVSFVILEMYHLSKLKASRYGNPFSLGFGGK